MSVGKKILGGYAVILALLLIVATAGYRSLQHVESAYAAFLDVDMQAVLNAQTLAEETRDEIADYRGALTYPEQRASFIASMRRSHRRFEAHLAKLRTLVSSAAANEMLESIAVEHAHLEAAQEEGIRLAEAGKLPEAIAIGDRLVAMSAETTRATDQFVEVQERRLAEGRRNVSIRIARDGMQTMVLSIMAVLLGLGFGLMLTRSITSRLAEAFAKLSASTEQLTKTLESIGDAFATINREWQFLYANHHTELLMRHPREDLIGRNLWHVFPELEQSPFGAACKQAMKERSQVTVEGFYPPLQTWLQIRLFPSPEGLALYGRDITSERNAQQQIAEQAALIDEAHDAIFVRDLEQRVTFWSKGAERMYGWTADEARGRRVDELLRIDSRPFSEALEALLNQSTWNGELTKTARDGGALVVESRWNLLWHAEGKPKSILSFDRDVTDKKVAQQRYQLIFDRNPYPLWVYDLETLSFLEVNESAMRHYGYTRDEFLSMTIADIRPREELGELHRVLREHLETPQSQSFGIFKHKKKDGTVIDVQITSSAITLHGRAAGLVLAMDVTEKRELEQQFFRAQRMESIGTLAGGIAHDLNNMLMPIMMGVSLLRRLNPDDRSKAALNNIERSAQRGKDLVSQVLSFARGVRGTRTRVRVEDVFKDMQTIIASTFPKNISLQMKIAANTAAVDADPTQLNQILLNLCVNARDAMPDGGRLWLSARNADIDEHYARMHRGMRPGKFVVIEVSDEGTGIAPEFVDRIFEPFFTTKEVGRGTGLGLSTVNAIVKSHGGYVSVYTEQGTGTTFRVYLQCHREQSDIQVHEPLHELPAGGGEMILIVDDEASILAITRETLEAFGYHVITAENGAEALRLFETNRGNIAAVITDVMMPVLDGPSLAVKLRRIEPALKVIGSSGMSEPAHTHDGFADFLRKPYSAGILLQTIRRVLRDTTR